MNNGQNSHFPLAIYIDNMADLRQMLAEIAGEEMLAVDTESNSLHAYQERVCLIQLSTRRADYIVDPLRCPKISALGAIFADPKIELIFHAAEYDIMTMKRDFGFTFVNLFDTMTAARILGIRKVGLSNLLAEYFGIRSNKAHQKDNWAKRPLPPSSLRYAQQDTRYLPALRDCFAKRLHERGNRDEALELFAAHTQTSPAFHRFDPEGYWSIAKAAKLSSRERAVLRECYLLREELAREKDRPPFKIMGKEVLIGLAQQAPKRASDLRNIVGLSSQLRRRSGERIAQAVVAGLSARPPKRSDRPRLDDATRERLARLLSWRKARAARRGVDADIIMMKTSLLAIAERLPSETTELAGIPGIGPWRLAEYGEELLTLVTSWRK